MKNLLHGQSPELMAYVESLNLEPIRAFGFDISGTTCELWVVNPRGIYRVVKRKRLDSKVSRETLLEMLGHGVVSVQFQCSIEDLATTTMTTEVSPVQFDNIRAFFEAQENIDE